MEKEKNQGTAQEVSDEELEGVAGGRTKIDNPSEMMDEGKYPPQKAVVGDEEKKKMVGRIA